MSVGSLSTTSLSLFRRTGNVRIVILDLPGLRLLNNIAHSLCDIVLENTDTRIAASRLRPFHTL